MLGEVHGDRPEAASSLYLAAQHSCLRDVQYLNASRCAVSSFDFLSVHLYLLCCGICSPTFPAASKHAAVDVTVCGSDTCDAR